MKVTNSKATPLKRRIKAVHRRARFVGTLYWLATIALAALACLPLLKTEENLLWVGGFYGPILGLIDGTETFSMEFLFTLVPVALYALMLIGLFINIIRCFANFSWLYTGKACHEHGCNRNLFAMEKLGKIFSASFASIILCNYVNGLVFFSGDITLYALIAIAAGLFIHFVCGVLGSKVTLFLDVTKKSSKNYHFTYNGICGWIYPTDNVIRLREVKREHKVTVFFFRNLFQVVFAAGLVYMFASINFLDNAVYDILVGNGIDTMLGNPILAVPAVLEVLMLLCLVVLIKHATGTTEYNRDCMEGKGMKNFKVFALFIFLLSVGLAVYFIMDKEEDIMSPIIMAVVAFVAFLLDVIIRPRREDEKEQKVGVFYHDVPTTSLDNVIGEDEDY